MTVLSTAFHSLRIFFFLISSTLSLKQTLKREQSVNSCRKGVFSISEPWKNFCHLCKASGVWLFLQMEALFLGSFLSRITAPAISICWTMLTLMSHHAKHLPSSAVKLQPCLLSLHYHYCPVQTLFAERQLWFSWNIYFDLTFSLLPSPRAFWGNISISCPTPRCSPNSTVLVVAPKLSLTEWLHRLRAHGLMMWNCTLPKFTLGKFSSKKAPPPALTPHCCVGFPGQPCKQFTAQSCAVGCNVYTWTSLSRQSAALSKWTDRHLCVPGACF